MVTVSSDKIDFIPNSKEKSASQGNQVGSLHQHSVELQDGEGVTKGTFDFITKINNQKAEGDLQTLLEGRVFTEEEMSEQERALQDMALLLHEENSSSFEEEFSSRNESTRTFFSLSRRKGEAEKVNINPFENREKKEISQPKDLVEQRAAFSQKMHSPETSKAPFFMIAPKKTEHSKEKERLLLPTSPKAIERNKIDERERLSTLPSFLRKESFAVTTTTEERRGEREKQREHSGGGQGREQEKQDEKNEDRSKKRKNSSAIDKLKGKFRASTITELDEEKEVIQSPLQLGDIFTRFMALMARILGQAQSEAHMLYQRIKERTDNVDILTTLLAKLNNNNKKVDWTKDPEMKALVDKARALGVEIPEGKYSWSEEEKRHLKENIQMRKDTLEKITQLERTDMQRFMQEVSQCHQARSNVLKMIKEIADTIIANLRGH